MQTSLIITTYFYYNDKIIGANWRLDVQIGDHLMTKCDDIFTDFSKKSADETDEDFIYNSIDFNKIISDMIKYEVSKGKLNIITFSPTSTEESDGESV